VTIELKVAIADEPGEELIAELADRGFDAFQHEEGTLTAWGRAGTETDAARAWLAAWLGDRAPAVRPQWRELPEQNWNALWEASVQPVAAGPFVVLPSWASPRQEHRGLIPLRIDPKMSFGTGHHASTRLALELLGPRVAAGARVLDVGTGTGILALGALKLGASTAIGCDIDSWSVPNARECAELNSLSDRFEVRHGDLDAITETSFDLVLANIIRAVLVPMLPALTNHMRPGATLILAGLLGTERDAVVEAAASTGLALDGEGREGEWWAGAFKLQPG
jgi:ribosomal protein L11 methyltransferase